MTDMLHDNATPSKLMHDNVSQWNECVFDREKVP